MEQESSRATISLVTMGYMRVLGDEELQDILNWVDQIPLTREKRNLTRDFSDGVTMAEIVKHFLPKYVELHQFTPASNTKAKEQNWFHLNRVLSKIGLELHSEVVHALAQCRPWAVENVLIAVRDKIEEFVQPTLPGRSTISHRAGDQRSPPKRSDLIHQTYDKQLNETIERQEQTIELLSVKVKKLEEVIRLRDRRINELSTRLEKAGYDSNETLPAAHNYSKKTMSSVNNRIPASRRK